MRGPAIGLLTLLAACGVPAHTCIDDGQCDRAPGGVCEPEGYCSYQDDACTGDQRFPEDTPGALAGRCIGREPDDGGGSCGQSGAACCPSGPPCADGLECVSGSCGCLDRLVAGRRHTCAIDIGGRVRCWGDNGSQQLVPGGEPRIPDPVEPSWLTPVPGLRLAAWEHGCVAAGGPVTCAGRNESEQAIPGGADPTAALEVPGLTGIEALAVGPLHSCAFGGGVVSCWGDDAGGKLGGAPGPGPVEVPLPQTPLAAELAAGAGHSCAIVELSSGREAWCWGDDTDGQLGDGPTDGTDTGPVAVAMLDAPSSIAAGQRHTCAVVDTAVWCWGANDRLQLGTAGGSADTPVMAELPSDEPLVGITAGATHTCAWSHSGDTWCWGANEAGQVDTSSVGTDRMPQMLNASLHQLEDALRMRSVAAGEQHTCVLTFTGEVACFGNNDASQLGSGPPGDAQSIQVDLGC